MGFENRQPLGMLIFLWGSGKISPTGSDGVRGFQEKDSPIFFGAFSYQRS
jgi:hypothetical protein